MGRLLCLVFASFVKVSVPIKTCTDPCEEPIGAVRYLRVKFATSGALL